MVSGHPHRDRVLGRPGGSVGSAQELELCTVCNFVVILKTKIMYLFS